MQHKCNASTSEWQEFLTGNIPFLVYPISHGTKQIINSMEHKLWSIVGTIRNCYNVIAAMFVMVVVLAIGCFSRVNNSPGMNKINKDRSVSDYTLELAPIIARLKVD